MAQDKSVFIIGAIIVIVLLQSMGLINLGTLFALTGFGEGLPYDNLQDGILDRSKWGYSIGAGGNADCPPNSGCFGNLVSQYGATPNELVYEDSNGINMKSTMNNIGQITSSASIYNFINFEGTKYSGTDSNFFGMDVSASLTATSIGISECKGNIDVQFRDGSGNSVCGGSVSTGFTGSANFKLESSFLNPYEIRCLVNGVEVGRKNLTMNELYFSASGSPQKSDCGYITTLKSLTFKPQLSCERRTDEMVAMETFAGPQQLSFFSTRYPITHFCVDLPTIVTDSAGTGQTFEINNRLQNAETLSVPSGQTWSLLYHFNAKAANIPLVCGSNQAYSVSANNCVDVAGIVQICSEGTFDPTLGLCVVTPQSKVVCEIGRYDLSQNACIYNPPVQASCSVGQYNALTDKCEYTPTTQGVCTEGTYEPVRNVCEVFPEKVINCPANTAYDARNDTCIGTTNVTLLTLNTAEEVCRNTGGVYTSITNTCKIEVAPSFLCLEGFSYNSSLKKCVQIRAEERKVIPLTAPSVPVKQITATPVEIKDLPKKKIPGLFIFNITLIVVILIAVGVLVFNLAKKK